MSRKRLISILVISLVCSHWAGAQDFLDYLSSVFSDTTATVFQTDSAVVEIDTTTPIPQTKLRPALVLPLSGQGSQGGSNMLDFYSGVLLAARHAGLEGLDIDLEVKDLDLKSLSGLEECDFIIGPIRPSDITRIVSLYPEKTVFSPLDQRAESLTDSVRSLVQIPPYSCTQFDEAVKWAMELHAASNEMISPNFILVASDSDRDTREEAKSALKEAGLQYHLCKCGVQGEIEGWETAYNPLIHNYVLIAISNEASLNNAVRNISIEVAKGNVTAFTGSKIRSYSSIPLENIHRAEIHAICSYYVDYEDPATKVFIGEYREFFHTFPSQFAFQGYDLASFAIRSFAEYGTAAWKYNVLKEDKVDLMQTSIKLTAVKEGGLVNEGFRRVEHRKDFCTVLVK